MANTKITSKVIADGNVLTAAIADDAVTSAKVADDLALGGNPTTTTQSAGNNTTRIATTAFVSTAVANLVDSAPSALDTLNELAAALGDDANFSTTVTNSIATKLPLAGGTLTGNLSIGTVAAGSSTATPVELNLGSTFADSAGSKSKMKLKLFEDTSSNILGFGISNAALEYHTNGSHNFYTNETENFRIDSNGNFSFGGGGNATNFSNYVTLDLRDSTGGLIDFSEASAGVHSRIQAVVNNSLNILNRQNYPLHLGTNDTTRLTITGSGNVGIATTSPTQAFEVRPNDDYQVVLGRARIGDLGYDDFAGFGHFDTGTNYAILQQDNGHTYVNAASGEDISFRIDNSDKMQLLSNGRVVIGTGTSSNAGLLVSNADIRCTAAAVANDANSISLSQESSGSFITARGPSTSERGTLGLSVNRSNGAAGIVAIAINNGGSVNFGGHTGEATGSTGGITMSVDSNDRMNLICATTTTGGVELIEFRNPNSTVGDILTTGTSTQFRTSSDYRLKKNLEPLPNGLDRLKQLNPVKFDWKTDSTSSEGFIAHEVQEIFADCVSGEKDGEKMQGIDYGRITPLLVKAIQEQQTIIEDLKSRIETLEG